MDINLSIKKRRLIMSSGQYKRHDGFNPIQVKDGWIVRIGKDGRIRQKIDPYLPKHPKRNENK